MEDDFAQSRGADDLFMDEFETPDESTTTYVSEPAVAPQPSPKPAQLSGENLERHTQAHYDQQAYQQQQNHNGGQNGGRGRGGRRGRGRGGNGKGQVQHQRGGGLASSKYADNNQNNNRAQTQPKLQNLAAAASAPDLAAQPDAASPSASEEAPTPKMERVDDTIASIEPPANPAPLHRIAAVRGDRTATGPPKPKKRSEAEITELMAAMKLKSSKAAEAHERTKRDQAESERREREARKEREEKIIKERQNVRAMDSERAKNAIRKQKAMQGREWDSEKQDSDLIDKSRGSSSRYMKGANGGVARNLQPSRETSSRMDEASRAVRSVEDEFPALGAGMSGARGAAGRGGGLVAKQGGRDLFPNGPGAGARGGRGGSTSNRAGSVQPPRGGGLATSRYADVASDNKRNANTDIRLEETANIKEGKKADIETGKKEFEELKKEGVITSWADEAGDAA